MLSIRIDVTLTDERILQLIRERADATGAAKVSLDELARALGCHRNTAWNSTQRLEGAGRIRQIGGSQNGRGGVVYEVLDDLVQ